MTPRFQRRMILLRAKRQGTFDRDQAYLTWALRAKAARKLRVMLRRGESVYVSTPPWSEPQAFFDDLSADLRIGAPPVPLAVLDLHDLNLRGHPHPWRPLIEGLFRVLQVRPSESQLADLGRNEFAAVAVSLLRARPPGSALVLVGIDLLPHEPRATWTQFAERPPRTVRLVLAGPGPSPSPYLPTVPLPDWGPAESLQALVELTGPADPARLRAVAELSGGVPALLRALAAAFRARPNEDVHALRRGLGDLGTELQHAWQSVRRDPLLEERLGVLADGPVRTDPDLDRPLVDAGLVRLVGARTQLRTRVLWETADR